MTTVNRERTRQEKLKTIHQLANKHANNRMATVMDEVNAIIMTDQEIKRDDIRKIIGREMALAFAKGYQASEWDNQPRIIS